jgi:hypothetical protein
MIIAEKSITEAGNEHEGNDRNGLYDDIVNVCFANGGAFPNRKWRASGEPMRKSSFTAAVFLSQTAKHVLC